MELAPKVAGASSRSDLQRDALATIAPAPISGFDKTRRKVAGLLLCLVVAVGLPAISLQAEQIKAGAAVGDITPQVWPAPLVGNYQTRYATEAADPLLARALVLDDGSTRLAIVTVDSCLVARKVFDEAKRLASEATGIRTDRMLMAATHTHSAPPAADTFLYQTDESYLAVLRQGIVDAVKRAADNLEPAELGWGTVDVPQHVFNRRWHMKPGGIVPNPFGETTDQVRMNPPRDRALLDRPAGPTDPEVAFISVRSSGGRPIAVLANYSLHYVGGVPAERVSADYFGEFAKQIKRRVASHSDTESPPFVGILSNGTSGDINNINFLNPRGRREPFEQIRQVAEDVADEVFESWQHVEYRDDVTLAMAQREVELGLRRPTQEQIRRAQEFLAEPDESKLPRNAKPYAKITLLFAEMQPTDRLILQALRIGDVGITAIPCEVFVEIGLEIKQRSPHQRTFTVELANGWNRYLPTPRQHRLGGYETWLGTNMLEVKASDKITNVVLELLNEVKQP